MILLLGAGVIVVLTIVTIVRSKKPLRTILLETKYDLYFNYLGSRCILEDMWMRGKNKTELIRKPGKIAVITGGARGIGMEVVRMLIKCDITVVIGCRNVQSGEMLLQNFRTNEAITTGDIHVYQLDISSSQSVKTFASRIRQTYPKIDYLINNAGIMFGPYIETMDGYESQFATNYLGHFLLTHLLLAHLANSTAGAAGADDGSALESARIVNVTSCAHEIGQIQFDDINCRNIYVPTIAYSQSKLAQILFSNHLNQVLQKVDDTSATEKLANIQVYSVHPGIVNTDLFNGTHLKTVAPWMPNLMFKTPEQGAVSIVHACVSPSLEGKGGTYIHNCNITNPCQSAKSLELQEALFNFTKKLLNIEVFGKID